MKFPSEDSRDCRCAYRANFRCLITSFVVVNAAFLTKLSINSSLASNDSHSPLVLNVDGDGTDGFFGVLSREEQH